MVQFSTNCWLQLHLQHLLSSKSIYELNIKISFNNNTYMFSSNLPEYGKPERHW